MQQACCMFTGAVFKPSSDSSRNNHCMAVREIHYIFSSHLRADQMCRGSFLGTHQEISRILSKLKLELKGAGTTVLPSCPVDTQPACSIQALVSIGLIILLVTFTLDP